ncbi:unnamed protein product [Blepharisma stoltei]|uniref:PAS domain-containing protein n=1 Tax=Blepharisma stoltei TaxID=1481888 RepID=A0AAU9JR74_9CILI|nr:unnamed protein product [Blepharisma stoltei]
MPHLITICILYLYNLNSYYISAKSFERFLSKKSAEERLNVVINLFTDGILIISENNQILYSNAHFNDLLGCSQNEILTILETIEYSQGRKYTTLTPSNYLIDDINWISTLQVNQEICFGLSNVRGNNLEWKERKCYGMKRKLC